ncbi:MAG: hypothetical protein ABR599_06255 [Gemmatimonadota bacterium]
MTLSPLVLSLLLALALVALLAGLRLFVLRPPERPHDYRAAFGSDPRDALRELLSDPSSAEAREAELHGDWNAAAAAYERALERLQREAADDPAAALKRRALASKLEELDRLRGRDG